MNMYYHRIIDHKNLCGSDDALVDYIHDVTCPDCLRLMQGHG